MKDNGTFAKAMCLLLTVIVLTFIFILCRGIGLANNVTTQDKFNFCMQKSGNKQFCREIFRECKAQAKNPNHCIATAMSIAKAESGYKTSIYGYFGYQGKDKTVKFWVSKYKKWWYKADGGFFFYGDWGKLGKSHYCTSEESSGSKLGCPNGLRHFNSVFFEYKNKFGL